jgi:hypothetical protein
MTSVSTTKSDPRAQPQIDFFDGVPLANGKQPVLNELPFSTLAPNFRAAGDEQY